ncbi:MAG: hypothetical protein I3273_02795 [Candidatus Moeniiplasma glomeromycotorum]|nr:hypothetical protein [Candidatus Moeniiplasma glomeromycotorum]MCE8167617.1 hypothetical protein [Candidatus Moeniiplasma glomeromycotorum]MCE8169033.1 hypothetical protein [Candidatus Moeniiplasma glomeromycotorum]
MVDNNESKNNGSKDETEERKVCERCRFKYRKSEMLEKEDGKWYCRRCAPWNIG